MTTTVLVPAFNEAARVGATVRTLLATQGIDDVLVIDDGSSDGTGEVARVAGARILQLPRNRGKGAALRAGLRATEAETLLFIDADLEESARVASVLLAPLARGEADMTIARPPDGAPSGFGIVERFARWGIERLVGARMERPLSGQRALRRTVAERCVPADRFGVEVSLSIDAVRAGFRVLEVPYPVEHARTGRDLSGFVHRARQGWDVARVLAHRFVHRGA